MIRVPQRTRATLAPSPLPVPLAVVQRVAAALHGVAIHLTESPPDTEKTDDPPAAVPRRLVLFDPTQPPTPRDAPLQNPPPQPLILEADAKIPPAALEIWAENCAAHDVVWSLTTDTMMRMIAPSRVFAACVSRLAPPGAAGDLRQRLETALHETLANALIHGNLEIPSLDELDGPDSGTAYERAVAHALADEDRAHRRILLGAAAEEGALQVWVRDEGAGIGEACWRKAIADGPAASTDKSGRGLYLTQQFCDGVTRGADGQSIIMTFRTGDKAAPT